MRRELSPSPHTGRRSTSTPTRPPKTARRWPSGAPTSSSSLSRGTRPTSTRVSLPSGGKPTTTRASGPSIFGRASPFIDGSPCDAEAVRASFERLLTLGLAPAFEMYRFLSDPSQISAPDPLTVVFTLDRPQPLFEAAVSSQYGGQIVNTTRLKELEERGGLGSRLGGAQPGGAWHRTVPDYLVRA